MRMRACAIGATTLREPKETIYIPYFLAKGIKKACRFNEQTNRWVTTVQRPDGAWRPLAVARLVYIDAFGAIPQGNLHVHHCDGQAHDLSRDVPSNYILLNGQWNMRYLKQLSLGIGLPEAIVTDAFIKVTGARPPDYAKPDAQAFKDTARILLNIPTQFHTPTLGTHLDCSNDDVPVVQYDGTGLKSPYLNTKITLKKGRYAVVLVNGLTTSHARRVFIEYVGDIKPGHHIHHIDSNKLNDAPENLMQMPSKFNSEYLPCIAEPLCVPESAIGAIYRDLMDLVPEEEAMYREVLKKAIELAPTTKIAEANAAREAKPNSVRRVQKRKPRQPPPISVACLAADCNVMVLAPHYRDKEARAWRVSPEFCPAHRHLKGVESSNVHSRLRMDCN